jgi:hypothetical protein
MAFRTFVMQLVYVAFALTQVLAAVGVSDSANSEY